MANRGALNVALVGGSAVEGNYVKILAVKVDVCRKSGVKEELFACLVDDFAVAHKSLFALDNAVVKLNVKVKNAVL